MTINPVSDPFHYMSIPVLSAFGLVFENALQELRYSYMNLIQTINSTGRWFMLPSDNNTIQLCTYDTNSASASVITLTIEIHHSHRWFLRHTTGVMLQNQHPVLAMVDKMFDCFNVSSLSKGKLKCKPFVQPYRNLNDFRLKVG